MAFEKAQTPNHQSAFHLITFYMAFVFQKIKVLHKCLFQSDNISAMGNT